MQFQLSAIQDYAISCLCMRLISEMQQQSKEGKNTPDCGSGKKLSSVMFKVLIFHPNLSPSDYTNNNLRSLFYGSSLCRMMKNAAELHSYYSVQSTKINSPFYEIKVLV